MTVYVPQTTKSQTSGKFYGVVLKVTHGQPSVRVWLHEYTSRAKAMKQAQSVCRMMLRQNAEVRAEMDVV